MSSSCLALCVCVPEMMMMDDDGDDDYFVVVVTCGMTLHSYVDMPNPLNGLVYPWY